MILALFLAGYLGQQYLPPPKPKVIGLDLGTTFCSVGVFHPGSGDVEVIADEDGRKSIPSAVSFTTAAVLAGHEAVDLADSNPQNTIYDAKRFIGKIFDPEVLEQESARYPFKVGHAGVGLADGFLWWITFVSLCSRQVYPSAVGVLLLPNSFFRGNFGMTSPAFVVSHMRKK